MTGQGKYPNRRLLHDRIILDPTNYILFRQLANSFSQRQEYDSAGKALEMSRRLQWKVGVVQAKTYDYISPKLELVQPDDHFPHMTLGERELIGWEYFRGSIPHNWYVDDRSPQVGFLSRDEAVLLYNIALRFRGLLALEIGCWMGWSACHLAMAGVLLDVVDPLLGNAGVYQIVSDSLTSAGVRDHVNLVPGYSPQAVQALAAQRQQPWSLIFIDGNHERPGPLEDAMVCAQLAAPDAAIVFHDLASPDVAEGLDYLRQQGWNTMVYQTMQIMGVAWRGQVQPVRHLPDPSVRWELPAHLQSFMVSGVSDGAISSPHKGA
jgi:predicted O-methyltransferase YrrM